MASRACRRVWPAGKAFQWSRFVERRVIRLREAGSGSLLSKIRLKILLVGGELVEKVDRATDDQG